MKTIRVNADTSDSAAVNSAGGANCVITVCTYNEHENLVRLVEGIRAYLPDAWILVVDDLSPDGTGALADELAQQDSRIQVHHRQGPRGLGNATLHAFQAALALNTEYVINLDADYSHHPRHLPELLQALQESGADVAIGSRYVSGGKIEGWPWRRHMMSRCINVWSRFWMKLTPRDCSGSYRCYKTSLLKKVDFESFRSRGYAVQEELLFRCAQAGAQFVEVPITFEDRRAGESKINLKEAVNAVRIIARCGMEKKG